MTWALREARGAGWVPFVVANGKPAGGTDLQVLVYQPVHLAAKLVSVLAEERRMFGHDWKPAEGTIVDSRITTFRPDGPGWNETPLHEFVVDVRMPDGTQFRTTVEEPSNGKVMPPKIGAVVQVQVDAKSQKVRFDEDDPTINTKVQWKKMHEAPGSFNKALRQPPGTPLDLQETRRWMTRSSVSSRILALPSHRKPEAVLLPYEVYERYEALARQRARLDNALSAAQSVQVELPGPFGPDHDREVSAYVDGEIDAAELYRRTVARYRQP